MPWQLVVAAICSKADCMLCAEPIMSMQTCSPRSASTHPTSMLSPPWISLPKAVYGSVTVPLNAIKSSAATPPGLTAFLGPTVTVVLNCVELDFRIVLPVVHFSCVERVHGTVLVGFGAVHPFAHSGNTTSICTGRDDDTPSFPESVHSLIFSPPGCIPAVEHQTWA